MTENESAGKVRSDDRRRAAGRSTYTADVAIAGAVHARFVRSAWPRARLVRVDVEAARSEKGVLAVWTGSDVVSTGRRELGRAVEFETAQPGGLPALAVDRVVYEGQPVAIVLAETAAAAEWAADRVEIEYEPEPSVAGVGDHGGEGGGSATVAYQWSGGDAAAVARELARSATVVTQRFTGKRHAFEAVEPAACVADWDAVACTLLIHVTAATPFAHRTLIAEWLGIPENQCRVVVPGLGGPSSGLRGVRPETMAVAWAATCLGRPVRWVADRREMFLAGGHGRDHVTDGDLGLDADGRISAIRLRMRVGVGASISTFGALFPSQVAAALSELPYIVPHIGIDLEGIVTATAPVEGGEETGCAEVIFAIERLMDIAAADLGMDPARLRLANLAPASPSADAVTMRSSAHKARNERLLNRVLERLGYAALRAEQAQLREQGRYRGVGITCYTGVLHPPVATWPERRPPRGGRVQIEPTGVASAFSGRVSGALRLEAEVAQAIAERVGLRIEDVAVHLGDTSVAPYDAGWPGVSEVAAIESSADEVRRRAIAAAAELLGVTSSDIEVSDGWYSVRGDPGRRRSLAELAAAVHRGEADEGALEATSHLKEEVPVIVRGAQAALVEIEAETGQVEVLRYVAIEESDTGHGADSATIRSGVVRGAGRALWEAMQCTSEGRLITDSMRTYTVARASQLPRIEAEEGGTGGSSVCGSASAAPATVANAVHDALAFIGIRHIDMPYTPATVWEAVRRAKQGAV